MDTYTKGVMTVIAICLVSITFQLTGTKPISNVQAELGNSYQSMMETRLKYISTDLRGIIRAIKSKKCN